MMQSSLCLRMSGGRVCVMCFYFVWCSFIMVLTKDTAAQQSRAPSLDFSRHEIVRPTIQHARTKREITSTKTEEGVHHPDLIIRVNIEGKEHILDLRLNEDLIPDNHVLKYQRNGEDVLHKPKINDFEVCQYSGTLRGVKNSWAAVSTCRGIRGTIFDGDALTYIEPKEGQDHYLYAHKDLKTTFHCGYNGGVTKNRTYDKHFHEDVKGVRSGARYKRETANDTQIRGPYNLNKLSRYVELVLVADHREFRANGESLKTVYHQLKDVANIINSLYAPLNIFIALVGVVVWNDRDEIQLEENGDTTLTNFLHYRKSSLLKDIPNDNAQLLTRQTFKDGVVGKALKGPICTYEFSGGVSTNHSEVLGLVATTIAHEMGHNFGMEHDNEEDCDCPDEKCIMSPSSTSVTPIHWSSCSLKSLALAFERGMDYCLRNKPRSLFESPTCGNGFVEPGEECDCGRLVGDSRTPCSACCRTDTCRLRSNATCATGQCCDLNTCKPKSAGAVCRSAERECDLPEYCTGYSEYCPSDVFKMDSTPCDHGEAYCVSGACRSHTDQCRLLWGTTGERSHDKCYMNINTHGDKNGNCGYDRVNQKFVPCSPEDTMCGLLHCRHLNEQLEFGMESVSTLSHTFINENGIILPCRTAIIDLGLGQVDPGLVPDGAKCGTEKMCLNQRCVAIADVQSAMRRKSSSVCPSDCSGHGVCNSEGQCHCESGFAPPLCALPGPGGSINSGPATDPTVQRNFMVAMYIIFLGIIPVILLILLLMYYSRHNVVFWWKKPRKSLQSPKDSLQRRLSRGASKFAANFQNNSNPGPGAPGAMVPSSPDDMSSSLLRSDSEHSPSGNVNSTVNFFGNFKGFSLAPIEKNKSRGAKNNLSPVAIISSNSDQKSVIDNGKSAKITPVHRSGSNSQNLMNQGILKPVLRTAPPLPVVPAATKTSPRTSPSVKRTNSSVQDRIKALIGTDKSENVSTTVAVNPPVRPVISSPILEASTCTAKELISPLQGSKTVGPVRAAPGVPTEHSDLPKRPASMHSSTGVPQKPLPEEPKKVREGISLNRIASFLKQEKPKEKERSAVERSNSLPKNSLHQVKLPKAVDKVALRNLQISNPILQKDIDLPVNTVPVVSDSEDSEDPKAFVNRSQSMRGPPVMQKPAIQSFGSMRQPRPLSTVGRPTAPPPPLPNNHDKDIQNSAYQHPKTSTDIKPEDYVDCVDSCPTQLSHITEESSDNIYAIIEELPQKDIAPVRTAPQPPPEGYNAPKPITTSSGSTDSMGLLGEIVNEIQNRNLDSIYSAATLARRRKEREKQEKLGSEREDNTYVNTDDYKAAESVYSNSDNKSSAASTTSSGYLHPSAVNVPTTFISKDRATPENSENRERAPPSPTLKATNSKIPTFTRQITPPGLKNTTTTTFRNVPSSPKSLTKITKTLVNSPDLVSSCAVPDTKVTKPPDVINNNKINPEPPKLKPVTAAKPSDNRPPSRPAPTIDKKAIAKSVTSSKPVGQTVKPSSNPTLTQDKTVNLVRSNSKTDSNVKAIADSLNKNKPKTVPKPSVVSAQRTDPVPSKTATPKLAPRPSNVASLQQKFENRKSFGRETTVKK